MNLLKEVKKQLLIRGFKNDTLINNRGLIGATIDEVILMTVKNNADLPIVSISTELLTNKYYKTAGPKLEVNGMELIQLKLQSNRLIKQHRKSIGLETPNNRVDQGDLRCVLSALNHLGFSIIRNEK